ncbi:DUF3885 domain-containing protein [Hymenobacter sediminis]|uniref:DUF3885 domain-containing protein n=1 Tax=Hymenobacter sediminis TaxID=2218621 RepID=UPI000DA6BB17|nr:DUF3885 domain-containing protein [Hymenobacter sediminis]RPD46849.1 DUF3885 domain-containing protein [Hymenobacter sediminis]
MALIGFLQQHYPSLTTAKPLFDCWLISLRFNLQKDTLATSDEAYFQEVIHRASLLFRAVFAPDEYALLVHEQWRSKRHRIRSSNYLLRQLPVPQTAIHFQRITNPYSDTLKWMRMHFPITISQIPYTEILAAISNQDFGRRPALLGRLFFLNQRTGLVFHMYDDRGLDIIGPDVASLRYLYEEFNELILDYDRPQIDALFAT